MKRMAWRWTLAASAMALAFAACTVTSSDDDEDAGTGGSGGSATGGTGGETGGTGGATGGTGGSSATGGSAGEAGTGGSGGATTYTCQELYPESDACSTCLVTNCCTEVEACANETGETATCLDSWECLVTTCTDPATYEDCKTNCDNGNYNTNYNDLVYCLENSCYDDCSG